MMRQGCRSCAAPLSRVFVDLGVSPLANSYRTEEQLDQPEPVYPLCALVCDECWLVQVPPVVRPEEIFRNYAYFSSWSQSWLAHCQDYVERMIPRLQLAPDSRVVEIASNDGYLLRYFVDHDIDVLGIEPAENVAAVARDRGIETVTEFFSAELAAELAGERPADLIIANNVLAHVPDLNDFVEGLKVLLADSGCITIEVPHLLQLIRNLEFDTIYHEHIFYFSLVALHPVMRRHGLVIEDVDRIPTHGGSLRLYVRHLKSGREPKASVAELFRAEREAGLDKAETYDGFDASVKDEGQRIAATVSGLVDEGARIAGYGAPAKGNTLLNYCGIGRDSVRYTVDANPEKQGKYLPGTHIPILDPAEIERDKPDYVFILPWNLRDEIEKKLHYISEWGGKFLVRMPSLEIVDP